MVSAGRQAERSPMPADSHYRRIVDDIIEQIRTGRLKPGDELPSIRQLETRYGVKQTTVKMALALLAEGGWTRGRKGKATYVADYPPLSPDDSGA